MNGWMRTAWLLVGLEVVAVVGGCTSAATAGPSATVKATATLPAAPSPTPRPAATPAPTGPITYGPVTVTAGTATCPVADLGPATTDAKGVHHYRNVDFRCTVRTNDPRVSGTHTSGAYSLDLWGDVSLGRGAIVQWGSPRLENSGGVWLGQATGVASVPDRGDIIAIWYEGTGDYAGLSYFELWTGQDPWTIQGQIFPGSPPTP